MQSCIYKSDCFSHSSFKTCLQVSALEHLLEWLREELVQSAWDPDLRQSFEELSVQVSGGKASSTDGTAAGIGSSNTAAIAVTSNNNSRWTRPSVDCLELARSVWSNEGVSALFAQTEDQDADSRGYFLAHFDRITSEKYKPTQRDIMAVWIPTTGERMRLGS